MLAGDLGSSSDALSVPSSDGESAPTSQPPTPTPKSAKVAKKAHVKKAAAKSTRKPAAKAAKPKAGPKTARKPSVKVAKAVPKRGDAAEEDSDSDSSSDADSDRHRFSYKPFAASPGYDRYDAMFAACTPSTLPSDNPSDAAKSPAIADLFAESTVDYTSESLSLDEARLGVMHRTCYDVCRSGRANAAPSAYIETINTGIPFVRTMRWAPFAFREQTHWHRILLVAGLRTPVELTVVSKSRTPEWQEKSTEVRCGDIARFSRILQLWRVHCPTHAAADDSKRRPARSDEAGSTLELTLPEVEPSEWALRDFSWLGKNEDVLAAVCTRQFHLASKRQGRRGIIAAVTNKGHASIYCIPDVHGEHVKLAPFATTSHQRTPLTMVLWYARKDNMCLLCGTLGGDVLQVSLLPDAAKGVELVVSSKIRGHSHGFVRKMEVMTLWHVNHKQVVTEDEEHEAPYPQDCLPALDWNDSTANQEPMNVKSLVPDVEGADTVDVLVSLGHGELKIRMWDMRMLFNSALQGVSQGARAKCFLSSFVTVPGGPVISGNEDSSIDTQPLSQVLPERVPAAGETLLSGGEVHAPIFHIQHASDARRRQKKASRPVDSLIVCSTTCGTVKLLRYAKRVFSNCIETVDGQKRTRRVCRVCMKPGPQMSLVGSACTCRFMRKRTKEHHVDLTNLLVTSDVRYDPPTARGERMKVSLDVKLAPTASQYTRAQDSATQMMNYVTKPFEYPIDLATSPHERVHMLAVALPGGTVLVLPL
eukprot:TRINITY_DN11783_c0_g2_i1.p1 TRINITY_DN11783_c0_g2~~TRINITY_DN11783_c0_g2_i1.p1  ORF type:complete len:801 (+),score=296.70 TRINITY_DN11783_c0_g2_i1:122-2404(+)